MNLSVLEIQEISFHRNGTSGRGFYAVRFLWQPEGAASTESFIATIFDDEGACAVIGLDRIEKFGIAFAAGNSWRGDNFEGPLREAISQHESSGSNRCGPFALPQLPE